MEKLFLPIFSPIFLDFCHLMHICNIPKLGGGLGGCINPWIHFFYGFVNRYTVYVE